MLQIVWFYYGTLAVFTSILFIWKRRSTIPLPPGPKGLPFVGNIRDIPPKDQWLTYIQWSHRYGSDLIHVKLPGAHMIVINSAKAAFDLLEGRSSIYSDRPHMPMIRELMQWDNFGLYEYGSRWRDTRRIFHQFFNDNKIADYRPQQTKAARELLHRLAHTPDDYEDHIRLMAGSFILDITYAIDVRSADDPFIRIAEKTMAAAAEAANPGSFLVDTLPILKYVPEWFPGAGFKVKAKEWREISTAAMVRPFQYVKDSMAKGIYTPSITSQALEQYQNIDSTIRAMSGVTYMTGADTTISAVLFFILAMVLHPEVARKAHQELDTVVGEDRLPDHSDKSSLPYICAVVKEVMRWHPVTPLGVAHRLMVDDVYNGMFLPAGSIVVGNAWAMLHDPDVYKDPDTFNPERFLKDGELDPDIRPPEDAAFGFGRRVCPGRHLALDLLFLNIACILAVFDIEKAIDEDGMPITPKEDFMSGAFCRPMPFKFSIKPRSQQAYILIADA